MRRHGGGGPGPVEAEECSDFSSREAGAPGAGVCNPGLSAFCHKKTEKGDMAQKG